MMIQAIKFDVVGVPGHNGLMTNRNDTTEKPRKPSSVRHTRAIQRDRSKRPDAAPPDEQIAERLTELIHPATLAQIAYFHRLGLRGRVRNLPAMVALVLSMVGGQTGEVSELAKMLRTEGLLWAEPRKVSQHALSQRFLTFPAILFLRILLAVLPVM